MAQKVFSFQRINSSVTVMWRQIATTGIKAAGVRGCWNAGIRTGIQLGKAGANPGICAQNGLITKRYYALSTEGESIEDKIDQITPHQYNKIANEYLDSLADDLETLSEDYPQIDCELSQGVMTLAVPPNGTYVINKQPPNKQIWLSSPLSGPKRYDLIGGRWITLRDNSSLTDLLEEEISQALETEYKFDVEA